MVKNLRNRGNSAGNVAQDEEPSHASSCAEGKGERFHLFTRDWETPPDGASHRITVV